MRLCGNRRCTCCRAVHRPTLTNCMRHPSVAHRLKTLIMTLLFSLPALINVVSLLALVTFTYAVLGVVLFTYLGFGENYTPDRNFVHIGNAFLLLFQCITGDGWSGLMTDAMVTEESGLCSEAAGDCGTRAALPYFLTFQVRPLPFHPPLFFHRPSAIAASATFDMRTAH